MNKFIHDGRVCTVLGISHPGHESGGILYQAKHTGINADDPASNITVYEGCQHEGSDTLVIHQFENGEIFARPQASFDEMYKPVEPEKAKTPEQLRAERFQAHKASEENLTPEQQKDAEEFDRQMKEAGEVDTEEMTVTPEDFKQETE